MVVSLHSRVKKISVALQITGLWLNLHFLLCSWTFKSDLQAGEKELLLVAVEQVHIPASGPLMLDLQRKCQYVSLTEIKVWKVEPTLPSTPRQHAQRFCTKSWGASGTACKKGQVEPWRKKPAEHGKKRFYFGWKGDTLHAVCFWKPLLWPVMLCLFQVIYNINRMTDGKWPPKLVIASQF